jgi:hypothetical protein
MSGMKKIAEAIALTSLVLGGVGSTEIKVSAQSQTTGGFVFGKKYSLLSRPGKLSDCIIRVKIAMLKDEIEYKCFLFAPIEDENTTSYVYAGDSRDKSTAYFQVGIQAGSPRDSKTRAFILELPGGKFERLGQVICYGGRKDGFQYSGCKAVSDDITVEGIYRLQE